MTVKYGASGDKAALIAAQMNFSMTAPPQKQPIIDLQGSNNNDTFNMSVKESLMNTNKNPMISPQTS